MRFEVPEDFWEGATRWSAPPQGHPGSNSEYPRLKCLKRPRNRRASVDGLRRRVLLAASSRRREGESPNRGKLNPPQTAEARRHRPRERPPRRPLAEHCGPRARRTSPSNCSPYPPPPPDVRCSLTTSCGPPLRSERAEPCLLPTSQPPQAIARRLRWATLRRRPAGTTTPVGGRSGSSSC
ncbi:uncharacterized protein STAUR_3820 [Stigmatella aurantiaca DW4/3-1]|uniref:Uncharacterized protein n=1 Tax=Stigmatella aurantiaca (strain DW4/3-1) TaxID=378806 RepID=E3FI02_STIAD|nr:uncharacterized protein STAUR_3820 [Stigmatella aurantiaca DW4/3-1]